MTNLYLELKRKHQQEVNDFPMIFAFSEEQYVEGMRSLGLQPDDEEKVCSIGAGGIILKSDAEAFKNMFIQHEEEMKSAMNDSVTGEQFIFDMFNYELSNHEYTYTYSVSDTIAALGMTMEEIEADERLAKGLKKACEYQWEHAEC